MKHKQSINNFFFIGFQFYDKRFRQLAYNDKVFEKGICTPFQKSKTSANYFLQKRCYKIGFWGGLKR